MSNPPNVLCLNASPALQVFDRPLLNYLAKQTTIAQWEYQQTLDEPSSLETAVLFLHRYLNHHPSVHLIGHGVSGLLALLYTQRYPERVRSLTLLSVGVHPAVDWQAHYYTQRQQLPCSRVKLLTRMVQTLFGNSSTAMTKALVNILERDLDNSLSPHSLLNVLSLPQIRVSRPLLVCGSVDDMIIDPQQLRSWRSSLIEQSTTQVWVCPGGRYFFHYFYPKQTGDELLKFWCTVEQSNTEPFSSASTRLTTKASIPLMLELPSPAVE